MAPRTTSFDRALDQPKTCLGDVIAIRTVEAPSTETKLAVSVGGRNGHR